MQVFLVAALTLVNLLLWAVFFIKFKKLFSIDNIMQEFRSGMERILSDTQRQTALSINLIEEKKKELKAVTAEAERRLNVLKHDMTLAQQGALLQTQISSAAAYDAAPRSKRKTPARNAAEKYKKNSAENLPGADESYMLTSLFRENEQRSLFEDGGQTVTVTNDGDSYGKIPLVKPEIVEPEIKAPKVTISENPIVPKKNFLEQVRDLSEQGKTIEEIAAQTSRSTTEVQLILDTI